MGKTNPLQPTPRVKSGFGGRTRRAIAQRLHCCGKTVAKALTLAQPPTGKPQPRGSILDDYRPQIEALVAKYPRLSAVRVREEIAKGDEGYGGGVGLVRSYLRQIRPARGTLRPTCRPMNGTLPTWSRN